MCSRSFAASSLQRSCIRDAAVSQSTAFRAGGERLMREHFAPFDLCQALIDFANEPLVVIDDPLDRVAHHGFGIAAPLACDARELGFQIWRQAHFHLISLLEACGVSTRMVVVA